MVSAPVDILNMLELVSWSPLSNSSNILSTSGYENGFCGRNDDSFKALRPHHVKQIHGTKIIQCSNATSQNALDRADGDALYTTTNEAIAIKTADCLPILLASRKNSLVMGIHAGWRGFTCGIIAKALDVTDHFTPRDSIVVCIGPSISQDAFEVGRDVLDRFINGNCVLPSPIWPLAVGKGKVDRWHIDLQLAAVLQLILAGIKPDCIEVIRSCTRNQRIDTKNLDKSQDPYAWHSYRREGQLCGSNWSWIKTAI